MFLKFYIIASTILFVSCNSGNINDFKRISGNWIEKNEQGRFVEKWNWVNDTLISGSSFMIQNGDTVFTEKLQLVFQDENVYYIPAVSNQNNGKEIRFKLLSKSKSKWVFENKKHDFPTQIKYNFKGADSMIVSVEGKENGKFQKYTFRMKKF